MEEDTEFKEKLTHSFLLEHGNASIGEFLENEENSKEFRKYLDAKGMALFLNIPDLVEPEFKEFVLQKRKAEGFISPYYKAMEDAQENTLQYTRIFFESVVRYQDQPYPYETNFCNGKSDFIVAIGPKPRP